MRHYLILCRSLTYGQKALRQLERGGYTVSLVKAPTGLSDRGCGYGLRLRREPEAAMALLRRSGIPCGRLFVYDEEGAYREVGL